MIAELARLYLEEVEDAATRRALEAASIVRRTTEPLLAAMLPDEDAADAMQRLLDLPFVTPGKDGLVLHDAVREAIAGFLHATNPVRYRAYRRTAWRELRSEVRDAPPSELWRYTAGRTWASSRASRPTGNAWSAQCTAIYRVEADRIAEAWVSWDLLSLLEQLGAVERAHTASA